MFKATQHLRGAFLGLLLVVSFLLCGPNARAQTATQGSLWAYNGITLSVCADPTSQTSLNNCFSGLSVTSWVGALMSDGVNVYALPPNTVNWAYSCPIAAFYALDVNSLSDFIPHCSQILIGPYNAFNYDSSWGYITAQTAAGGYLYTAQLDGTVWKCPNNLPWNSSIPIYSTPPLECVLLDNAGAPGSHGSRYGQAIAIDGDALYVGLIPTKNSFGTSTLIWKCDANNPNSCQNLDSSGTNNWIYSLEVGAGYLWAGLENGILWRCDLVAANSCTTWDTAGQNIADIAYDGAGTLAVTTTLNGYEYEGVFWSCPTSTPNSCTTLVQSYKAGNYATFPSEAAAGDGNIWAAGFVNEGVNYETTFGQFWLGNGSSVIAYSGPFLESNIDRTPRLIYIPAGGTGVSGSARVQLPFTGDAARLSKYCSKQGRRAMANISVSGPYGMKVKRRVNLCKFYDASALRSEIEFSALDHGQYRVTVQSRSFYGQADFVLNDNNVQDVSVTLRKRRK